jgi:hypothetical protein
MMEVNMKIMSVKQVKLQRNIEFHKKVSQFSVLTDTLNSLTETQVVCLLKWMVKSCYLNRKANTSSLR